MNKNSGVHIDLDREFYKQVKKFCVNNELKIKDFVYDMLKMGMTYGKKSSKR